MKILLVADVGTNAAGFYHVGDEAMLHQTIQWYRKQHSEIDLGLLSRSKSHKYPRVNEELHLPFPSAAFWLDSPWYCFSLMLRFTLHRSLGLPVLRKTELQFIQFVATFDCLHFTGGGNIYSYHAPWLYYVFFLLFLGKRLNKKIWLTSQTIGPFNWFDGMLAKWFLRLSDVIVLRSHSTPLPWKTFVGLDAAYELSISKTQVLPQKPAKTLRIGLSLHDWQSFGSKLSQAVASALNQLSETQKLELVVIPHVITRDESTWDSGFMAKITQSLSPTISLKVIKPVEILGAAEPPVFVKTITSELDLMIATRYHGLVFALSSNVPAITFKLDDYYVEKNSQLLALVYKTDWQRFIVDLDTANPAQQLLRTIHVVNEQLAAEKTLLKKQNHELSQDTSFYQLLGSSQN